jgi:osmotically-inducible protein OsmY
MSMRLVSKWSRVTALASVALIAACATSAPKSPEQAQADEATAQRIYAALNADPTYFYRHVDVRVDGGVAQLGGYIWSTAALYRAKQIAAGVPGVRSVVNAMELEREGTRGGGGHSSG